MRDEGVSEKGKQLVVTWVVGDSGCVCEIRGMGVCTVDRHKCLWAVVLSISSRLFVSAHNPLYRKREKRAQTQTHDDEYKQNEDMKRTTLFYLYKHYRHSV